MVGGWLQWGCSGVQFRRCVQGEGVAGGPAGHALREVSTWEGRAGGYLGARVVGCGAGGHTAAAAAAGGGPAKAVAPARMRGGNTGSKAGIAAGGARLASWLVGCAADRADIR